MSRTQEIIDAVSAAMNDEGYDISPDVICSKGRRHVVCIGRNLSAFMLRQYLEMKYTEIANFLGRHHHGTVMHGERKAVEWVENIPRVGRVFTKACSSLGYEPPDWLHVDLRADKPITKTFKGKPRSEIRLSPHPEGELVRVYEYTPEEKKAREEWLKDPRPR